MQCRCLVLQFSLTTRTAYCFSKKKLDLICLKLEEDKCPKPGQFLIYDENELVEDDGILRIQNVTIEDSKNSDYIHFNRDETFRLSSWIAFSSDETHQTFNRKIAFADWYGFVDCSETDGISNTFDAYRCYLVVKDFNYKQNQTQLFKVESIKRNLSEVCTKKQKKEYEELLDRTKVYEETIIQNRSGQSSVIPRRPSRSIDEKKNENRMRSTSKNRGRSRSQKTKKKHSMNVTPLCSNFVEAPSSVTSPEAPILPIQTTSVIRDLIQPTPLLQLPNVHFRDCAVVMKQISENEFIVWMNVIKNTAKLLVSNVGLVRLGAYYSCQYTQLLNDPISIYEVINIEQSLEFPPFKINHSDEETVSEIIVDLCSPNTKCQSWSFYMGIPFLNSPQVGIVTMADYVDTPTGCNVRWQEALRRYLGNPGAQEMQCECRLVKQKIPQKMFDPFQIDEFRSVERYTWQLIRICAKKEFAENREREIKMENLQENALALEQEDEIAREKREARARVHFDRN